MLGQVWNFEHFEHFDFLTLGALRAVLDSMLLSLVSNDFDKVHIFWEGHKILRNLHQSFYWQYVGQIIGGDFAKFCGLLRIYKLYR